jgi:dihydropteroate synthase
MLYKPLDSAPSEVLPATIAANTIALEHGANILRVHDVAAAKQAIATYLLTHKYNNPCSLV